MFATDKPSVWGVHRVWNGVGGRAPSGRTHEGKRYQRAEPRPKSRTQASRRSGQDTARLRTPELVERGQPDVDRGRRTPRQVAAEAEQPAGHQVLAGLGERLRGGGRLVEPGGVDALETGEQRIDPAGTDGTRAPVDEHDRTVRTHEQVVVADVPVREARRAGCEQSADEVAAA